MTPLWNSLPVPSPHMSYQVKTQVFEGPLDLLLQLITSHQVHITELSLTDLVAEYLVHVEAMRDLDLEVTSEFLLIAATLIQLKARHLLPDDVGVDIDEELALAEERDRLLSRLLACLTFKDVAAVLRHRMETEERYVARRAGLDPDVMPLPPDVSIPIDADGLSLIAARVFAGPLDEPDIDHLDLDLPSVQEAMSDIQLRMSGILETDFTRLIEHCRRSVDVVAYFLALLELARWGIVSIDQEERDAPIAVAYDADAAANAMESMLRGDG